jgi:egghead protein (zeste-white 4 protein)
VIYDKLEDIWPTDEFPALTDTGDFSAILATNNASATASKVATAVKKEGGKRRHRRTADWTRARHRGFVLVLVLVSTAGFYAGESLLWPRPAHPSTLLGQLWSWLDLLWVLPFVPAAFELAGLMLWRPPRAQERPIPNLVSWRIVSRGINTEALYNTIIACRKEMSNLPLFPYLIEVVVDTVPPGNDLPPATADLRYIVVPKDYTTPNNSRAKARALNYALRASLLPPTAWLVHMDEESRPTASSITGIAAAIREEEISGRLRIGQGTITYHRDWKYHPFLTLSDCIRTGSDLGRLYLSMRVGVPLFGLHGSFILVRNDVEQALGFDIGPVGSLTEDAWWGTIAMDLGYRCRWVEGHVAEQCTFRVRDFLKQRRRWFNGMGRTATHAPVSWRWRAMLGVSMITWATAPIAWAYTLAHLVLGGYVSPVIQALANISLAVYVTTTLVGLGVNMADHGIWHPAQKVRWGLTWLVCLPAFSLLESSAVAYALIRPAKGFDVVKK